MITLDTALADYLGRCQASSIASYPLMWAGHYGPGLLGEIGIPGAITDLTAYSSAIMAPFAFCEKVTDSFLITDGAAVPDYSRNLFVVHLAELKSGHLALTPYEIPYSIEEGVGSVLGQPKKDWFKAPALYAAMNKVFQYRTEAPKHTFDEVYVASVDKLNELV